MKFKRWSLHKNIEEIIKRALVVLDSMNFIELNVDEEDSNNSSSEEPLALVAYLFKDIIIEISQDEETAENARQAFFGLRLTGTEIIPPEILALVTLQDKSPRNLK